MSKYFSFKFKKKNLQTIVFISLVIFSLLIQIPFLSQPGIPLSDASMHLFRMWFMEKEVSSGRIPLWTDDSQAGFPIFRFYPPGVYMMILLVRYLSGLPWVFVFKLFYALSYATAILGIFMLCDAFELDLTTKFFASLLFIANTRISFAFYYSAGLLNEFTIGLGMVLFALLIQTLHKKRNPVFTGLFLGLMITIYHLQVVYTFIIFIVYLVFYLIIKKFKVEFKGLAKKAVVILIIAFAIASYWVIPFLMEFNYYPFKLYPESGKLKIFFKDLVDPNNRLFFLNYPHIVLTLIGVFLILFKKQKKAYFLLIWIGFYILISRYQDILKIFPLGGSVDPTRGMELILFPMCIVGGFFLSRISYYLKRHFFKIIILVVIIIILYPNIMQVIEDNNSFRENAYTDPQGDLKWINEQLNLQKEIGRFSIYGIYYVVNYASSMLTPHAAIQGSFPQEGPNFKAYVHRINQYFPMYAKPIQYSVKQNKDFLYNLFLIGGVRYLFIRAVPAQDTLEIFNLLLDDSKYELKSNIGACDQTGIGCTFFFKVKNLNMLESVSPYYSSDIENTTEKIINQSDGSRIVLINDKNFPEIKDINKSISELKNLPGVNIISWSHDVPTNFKIELNSEKETYVVLKETYYPKWVLKINNKEEKYYPTQFSFIMFKIPAGNSKIELSYPVRWYSYFGSIITIMGLVYVLYYYKGFFNIIFKKIKKIKLPEIG